MQISEASRCQGPRWTGHGVLRGYCGTGAAVGTRRIWPLCYKSELLPVFTLLQAVQMPAPWSVRPSLLVRLINDVRCTRPRCADETQSSVFLWTHYGGRSKGREVRDVSEMAG